MKAVRLLTGIAVALLAAAPAGAAPSGQDNQIAISPVVQQFPVTALNSSSSPLTLTVSNLTSAALNINGVTLGGTNPGEFAITANNCPGSLAGNATCSIAVAFKPSGQGTKSALLLVASDATATPVLTAYLTNSAGGGAEAEQRVPASIAAISVPSTMTAGGSYDLSWTVEGYDDSYKSYAVLFDCTGLPAGACGNSYGDASRFAESAMLTPSGSTSGDWSYNGVTTRKFEYHWTYVPTTRSMGNSFAPGAGSDVVIRFYVVNGIDAARNNGSVSLLIPGKHGSSYYDTAGRRVLVKIKQ